MPFAKSTDADIYYETLEATAPWVQQPDTIVFNHGIGINRRIWARWLPALIDRYRIVLLDMRGFGRSAIPAPDAEWRMDQLVDDVMAVAKAAGAERFHFVGESMGGTVGLCTALRHPDAIASVTVSNGAHIGGSLQNLNDWRDIIKNDGMAAWSRMMSGRRFYDDGLTAEEREWFEREQAACSGDSCLNAVAVLRGMDLRADLQRISMPVLLLHGDASPFIPLTITAELHAGLPDSEVQVFAHAKHGLPFSHGRECGLALRAFLERVVRRGTAGTQ